MKTVSLFTGCGGLDWGYHQLNFEIVWANDILEDSCKTYKGISANHY